MPALVAAENPMVQPRRPIERQPYVPFHVTVEAEKIAEIIDAEARRIAPSISDAFPILAVRTDAVNRSFALDQGRGILLRDVKAIRQPRAVAGHEINVTVVPAQQCV